MKPITSIPTMREWILFGCLFAFGVAVIAMPLSLEKRIELLVSLVASVLGILLGSVLASRFAMQQLAVQTREQMSHNRSELAWEMHREFNGPDLNVSRSRAHAMIKRYPSTPIRELRDAVEKGTAADRDSLDHLWNHIFFYVRLSLAVKLQRIDTALVAPLFGELFCWWYEVVFEPLYQTDSQASKNLSELKDWLDKNADPVDVQRWRQRGKAARDKIVSDYGKHD
jgi:hypothetical protein